MRKSLFKIVAIATVLMMLFSQVTLALSFNDIGSHWAKEEIEKWSGKGLLEGSNGVFKPNNNITRAEMAVIIDRLMKYQVMGDNEYKDLGNTWYTEAILKNSSVGVIQGGNGYVRPKDAITRQEAVVMLSRAMQIEPVTGDTSFNDNNKIASWAKGYVKAFSNLGYIQGKGNGDFFAPKENITRAAVVKIVDNMLSEWITKEGTYTEDYDRSVIINTDNVILKDLTIGGDLIIAEGVADGEVTLDNVEVIGSLKVRGGGENSIYLNNTQVKGSLLVDKHDGKIRIVASGDTKVKITRLSSSAILVEKSLNGGAFEKVVVSVDAGKDAEIVIDGAVREVEVLGDDCKITVKENTVINKININGSNTEIVCEGQIESIDIGSAGEGSTIQGEGVVEEVTVGANNVKVETDKSKVVVNNNISGTEVNGEKVSGGDTVMPGTTPSTPSTGSGGSGSGGGGGYTSPPKVTATSIEINEGDSINIYPSETKILTTTVLPANTTDKSVIWSTTEPSKINVSSNGVISVKDGVYNTTANVEVTSNSSSSVTDTITVNILQDNLADVGTLNDISQGVGIEKGNIKFPTEITLTLDTGKTIQTDLGAFNTSQGVTYDKDQAGTYQFEATATIPASISDTGNIGNVVTINVIVTNTVDAETPSFNNPNILTDKEYTVGVGNTIELDATASVSNGKKLTYTWYYCDDENGTNPQTDLVAEPELAQPIYSMTPDQSQVGVYYLKCIVTNKDDNATGNKTATIETPILTLRVVGTIEINKVDQLALIGNDPAYPMDGSYKLTCDLDFNDDNDYNDTNQKAIYTNNNGPNSGFTPIGGVRFGSGNSVQYFTGTFDGKGYTITGLTMNRQNRDNQGLFHGIQGGTVKNLNLASVRIVGDAKIGGIAGSISTGGVIENCSVTGSVTGYGNYVGGIVGNLNGVSNTNIPNTLVTDCYSEATVSGGSNFVGGIAGRNLGIIRNCYNTRDVNGFSSYGSDYVGGIAGINKVDTSTHFNALIESCYNTGDISAKSRTASPTYGKYVGGIVGGNLNPSTSGTETAIVRNCYSTGDISGKDYIGGIAGLNDGAEIENTYSTGDITALSPYDGYVGGIAGSSKNDSASAGAKIINSIAFNNEIAGKNNVERIASVENAGDTTFTNNFANSNMVVTEDGGSKTGTSDNTTTWGQDANDMTDSVENAYNTWEIDSDTNNDGVYWKVEYGADRPVLYVDGTKLGSDNGLLHLPQSGPIQIGTLAELQKIGTGTDGFDFDSEYVLTADIDASSISNWTPIGGENEEFTGSIDGGRHKIKGLSMTGSTIAVNGFIRNIGTGGEVKNIIFENPVIDITDTNVYGVVAGVNKGTIKNISVISNNPLLANRAIFAGIAYKNEGGSITECSVEADITGAQSDGRGYIAGITSFNKANSTIDKCIYDGDIVAKAMVAGIAYENFGTVKNLYSTGSYDTADNFLGGIVGENRGNGEIINCYSTADLTSGGTAVGGIAGSTEGNSKVSNCYATGAITGTYSVGGIVGANNSSDTIIENCIAYNTSINATSTNGQISLGKIAGSEKENNNYTNNYSKATLQITKVSHDSYSDESHHGTNITSMTDINSLPLSSWEFDSDTDGDGAYWKIESGKERPVLYFDVGSGTFYKLGDDTGMLASLPGSTGTDINTVADLQKIGESWSLNGVYNLKSDLDLSGVGFSSIGSNTEPFTGVFYGEGHTISNLTIDGGQSNGIGLFSNIKNATITDLALENVDIKGGNSVGGITGTMSDSSIIENCSVSGQVTARYSNVGGIAGFVVGINNTTDANTTITKCYSTANVNGQNNAGGLVGQNSGSISFSYSKGDVTVSHSTAGGIAGVVANYEYDGYATAQNPEIKYCYALGDVTSTGGNYIGGIAGLLSHTHENQNNYVSINRCYTTSDVSGVDYVGGFVGRTSDKSILEYSIAFGANVTATNGIANRITTYNTSDDHSDFISMWAKNDMVVTQKGNIKSDASNDLEKWGFDIENLTSTQNAPLRVLPLDSNNDTREAYFKKLLNTSRLVLFVNNGGTYVNLGNDDGLLTGMTATGPFDINTAEDLLKIGTASGWTMSETYNLRADIDLSTICNVNDGSFTPIGTETEPFTGNFYGNGHTISNLFIHELSSDNIGLFGVAENADIREFTLEKAVVRGKDNVGGFVGKTNDGLYSLLVLHESSTEGQNNVGGIIGYAYNDSQLNTLDSNSNIIQGFNSYLGGIVGKVEFSKLIECNVNGNSNISGKKYVGGVAGYIEGDVDNSAYIERSSVGKEVLLTADGNYLGGIAGMVYAADILASYVNANVTGVSDTESIGGIVGLLESAPINTNSMTDDQIANGKAAVMACYTAGTVKASGPRTTEGNVGGLVGESDGGMIKYSYSIGDVTGYDSNVGGIVGEIGSNSDGSCAGLIHSVYTTSDLTAGSISEEIGIGGLIGRGTSEGSNVVYNSYAANKVFDYDKTNSNIHYNVIRGDGYGGIHDTQYHYDAETTDDKQGTPMVSGVISKDENDISKWDFTETIKAGENKYWWVNPYDNNANAVRPVIMIRKNQVGDDDGSASYNQ